MKRNEIRIINPDKKVWNTVNAMAKKEKRTLSGQGEFMISEYIRLTQSDKTKK